MGVSRRRLPDEHRRQYSITMKVTKAEYETAQHEADLKGVTRSSWARAMFIERHSARRDETILAAILEFQSVMLNAFERHDPRLDMKGIMRAVTAHQQQLQIVAKQKLGATE